PKIRKSGIEAPDGRHALGILRMLGQILLDAPLPRAVDQIVGVRVKIVITDRGRSFRNAEVHFTLLRCPSPRPDSRACSAVRPLDSLDMIVPIGTSSAIAASR